MQQFLPDIVRQSERLTALAHIPSAPSITSPTFEKVVLIPLRPAGFAVIDPEDYELVSQYKWRLQAYKTGHIYAQCTLWKDGKSIMISMHRLIMGFPSKNQINHWDDNGLNNRRNNLVICTYAQNQQYARKRKEKKSSKYKGVSYSSRDKIWRVYLRINKKKVYFGSFKTENDAALAYDKAAIKHFGEFARINFNGAHNK